MVLAAADGSLGVLEGATGTYPSSATIVLPQGGEVVGLVQVVLQRPFVAALAATGADSLRVLVEVVESAGTTASETGQA